jgi:hypothetical protein
MMLGLPAIVAMLLLFFLWVLPCIHRVRDRERLAVHRLGRFIDLKGPGLVFIFFPIDRGVRLAIGDPVQWLGEQGVAIRGMPVPAEGGPDLEPGAWVVITGFSPEDVRVERTE